MSPGTTFEPMLAQPSKTLGSTPDVVIEQLAGRDDWVYDLKLDGIRCLAYAKSGLIRLINRRGVEINFRYPEIDTALGIALDARNIVLDGEIVCFDRSEMRFDWTHRRDAQNTSRAVPHLMASYPASYMPFDVLVLDGRDVRREPYKTRLQYLHGILQSLPPEVRNTIRRVPQLADPRAMWTIVNEHHLEGMIAKRLTSPYVGRRSPAWVKIKRVHTVTAMASGYDLGEKGGRLEKTVGAVHLSLLDSDMSPVFVGKVGTGFTDKERDEIKARLDKGEVLILEVQAQELSRAGQLRMPAFKCLRNDVSVLDCTLGQLQ